MLIVDEIRNYRVCFFQFLLHIPFCHSFHSASANSHAFRMSASKNIFVSIYKISCVIRVTVVVSQKAHPFCCVRLSDTRVADTIETREQPKRKQNILGRVFAVVADHSVSRMFCDGTEFILGTSDVDSGRDRYQHIRCNENKTTMYSYCVFCSDTTNLTDTWYPPSIHPTVHEHTQTAVWRVSTLHIAE